MAHTCVHVLIVCILTSPQAFPVPLNSDPFYILSQEQDKLSRLIDANPFVINELVLKIGELSFIVHKNNQNITQIGRIQLPD